MIKVLLITNDGNHGGINNVIRSFLEFPEACEFRLLCGSNGKFVRDMEQKGVDVQVVDLQKPLLSISAFRDIYHEVKRFQPDVIHSHHPRAYQRGRIAAFFARIPHVSTPHTSFLDELANQRELSFLRRQMILLRERITAPLDARTIALSDYQREMYVSIGIPGKNICVISNGISLTRFYPAKPVKNADSKSSWSVHHKLVGVISRLTREKGIDDLISAFKDIPSQADGVEVKLAIIGEGPFQSDLERQVEELGLKQRVHFYGHREDIPALLQRLDLVVFPSHYEGQPLTLLEAMATGRPIVAVDLPVFQTILGIENGLVVARSDLAKGITTVLTDSELAAKYGLAARQVAEQNFDQLKNINRTYALYREIKVHDK